MDIFEIDLLPDHLAAWRRLRAAMEDLPRVPSVPCALAPDAYMPAVNGSYPARDAALRACIGCPVRAECGALGPFERKGIWGGQIWRQGKPCRS